MPFSHEIYFIFTILSSKSNQKRESNKHDEQKGIFTKGASIFWKHENGSIMNEFNWLFSFYSKPIVYIYCVKCDWIKEVWMIRFVSFNLMNSSICRIHEPLPNELSD